MPEIKKVTMANKLNELDARIVTAFLSGEEQQVLDLREQIVKVMERMRDIRTKFDNAVDSKEMHGIDTFKNVTRIRKAREAQAKEIKEDTTLDF